MVESNLGHDQSTPLTQSGTSRIDRGTIPGAPGSVLPNNHNEALVEALLFVADRPVRVEDIATVLAVEFETVQSTLERLAASLEARALRLQRVDGHVQLVTAPEIAPYVERFLGLDTSLRLSPAALETLAVTAYRQPVTRAQVEAIRGVSCGHVLRGLIAKGLLEPVGRLDKVGRPIIYATTPEFLQYFGLPGLAHLPPIRSNDPVD